MSETARRRHQRMRRATPRRKSSACTASAAALIAPADVPQTTGKGKLAAPADDAHDGAQRAHLVRGARAAAREHDRGLVVGQAHRPSRRYAGARSVRSRIISIAAVAPQMKRSP